MKDSFSEEAFGGISNPLWAIIFRAVEDIERCLHRYAVQVMVQVHICFWSLKMVDIE